MFSRFLIWLKGYLIIHIVGDQASIKRFLNICTKHDIAMWQISNEKEQGFTLAYVTKQGYEQMLAYTKKTGVALEINDKCGAPYIFYRYRKRKLFALGVLIFVMTLYVFSFFIWDISIDGEERYTDEQIINELDELGVGLGTPKNKIDCSKLEKLLREKYDGIAWISCEITGTRLNININETISPELIKENTEPCNIIALKSGIITDMIVESGTRVANCGDEVNKGDILITGAINLYNDYNELMETSYVPANGAVYAICSYDYEDTFSLEYYDKEYTGDKKSYYGLVIGGTYRFMPIKPKASYIKKNYDNYDTVNEDNTLRLGNSFYLPIAIEKCVAKEYVPTLKIYSEQEAYDKARLHLGEYISEFNKKGVEILENNVKIAISDTECVASGTLVTKELIGVPDKLNLINQGAILEDGIY